MSSHSRLANKPSLTTMTKKTTPLKKHASILATSLAVAVISTGCTTTQEIKPTASVMAGAHTTL